MRLRLWSQVVVLLITCSASVEATPKVHINDPRFSQYIHPEATDVRSSCPGLNTLANHGFLPRNGRGINITSLIVAAFEGFGVSPETSGLVTMGGLISSKNKLSKTFTLAAVQRPDWEIEHDCSISRKDRAEDPHVAQFDAETWEVTFSHLRNSPIVSAFDFGRAKAARMRQHAVGNPNTTYNSRAAGNSALEIALVMNTLGNLKGWTRLEYLRVFFEEERFPWDIGWRPHVYSADIGSVLGTGALILNAEPELLGHTSDGTVLTPTDIIKAIHPGGKKDLKALGQIIKDAGFDNPVPYDQINRFINGDLRLIY